MIFQRHIRSFVLSAAILSLSTVVAQAAEKVYVPLGSGDSIQIIDPSKNEIVGKIDGLPAVHGLAGSPDGRLLIAGSFDERDPGSPLPERPKGVSADDHESHHQPKKGGESAPSISTATILDAATHEVLWRIDLPGAVHHVAVSPESRFAAFTHPAEDAVSIVDLHHNRVTAKVNTGAMPNYAVFAPDGRVLYVSDSGSDQITEINVDDWRVSRRLTVGESPEHVVLSADGKRLYVNNVNSGTVSEVDLGRWREARTFKVGNTPHGIGLSDSEPLLFVSVMNENKLVRVDLRDGSQSSVSLAPAPYHLTMLPGQAKLYVTSADDPRLWVVNTADFALQGEIAIGGKGHQMVPMDAF